MLSFRRVVAIRAHLSLLPSPDSPPTRRGNAVPFLYFHILSFLLPSFFSPLFPPFLPTLLPFLPFPSSTFFFSLFILSSRSSFACVKVWLMEDDRHILAVLSCGERARRGGGVPHREVVLNPDSLRGEIIRQFFQLGLTWSFNHISLAFRAASFNENGN